MNFNNLQYFLSLQSSLSTDLPELEVFMRFPVELVDTSCSAIRGFKGGERKRKRKRIGYCGPSWRTHVCNAAHDYFNYLIIFTN